MPNDPYRVDPRARAVASTTRRPRWRPALAIVLAGIGVGVGVATWRGAFEDPFPAGFGAALACVAAVGLAAGREEPRGSTKCPACSAEVRDLPLTGSLEAKQCDTCGGYLQVSAGRVSMVEPDAVCETPRFGVCLPRKCEWPPGCVVCRGTATQQLRVRLPELTRALLKQDPTVLVPHCDRHDDGADLGLGSSDTLWLRFRSYSYQREFAEMNRAPVTAQEVESWAHNRVDQLRLRIAVLADDEVDDG
jgi:hypothetical protein